MPRITVHSIPYRHPHDLIVQVDSSSTIPHHHMMIIPQSPVSILQNSPIYSPVKDPPCSPPSSFPSLLTCGEADDDTEKESGNVCHDVEEEEDEEEKTSPWSSHDRDEGIESESGEDDQ